MADALRTARQADQRRLTADLEHATGQASVLVSVHGEQVLFVGPVELVAFLAPDPPDVCAV